ncbi:MAG TPA: hypothetical protein VLC06_16695, partial [Polyangia bacterium]|nr:hypothetical protein [Polyangia bacterium]
IARRLRSRSDAADESAGALLFWGAAIACVVTSPTGWVMGLVLALPLAPRAAALVAEGRLPPGLAMAGALAWIAVALPAPFAGWSALAGAALIVVAIVAADAAAGPISPGVPR